MLVCWRGQRCCACDALAGAAAAQVAAGSRHSVLLAASGELFLFGNGEEGQMGLGRSHLVPAVVSPVLLPVQLASPSAAPAMPTFVVAGGDCSAMVSKQVGASSVRQPNPHNASWTRRGVGSTTELGHPISAPTPLMRAAVRCVAGGWRLPLWWQPAEPNGGARGARCVPDGPPQPAGPRRRCHDA